MQFVSSDLSPRPDSLRAYVLPDQAFMMRVSFFQIRVSKSLYVFREASTLTLRHLLCKSTL